MSSTPLVLFAPALLGGLGLGLWGAGFGHLDGGLAVYVEQRLLQRPRAALGAGGRVTLGPTPELVLAVRWQKESRVFLSHCIIFSKCFFKRPQSSCQNILPPKSFFQLQGTLHLCFLVCSLQVASRTPAPQSPLVGTHLPYFHSAQSTEPLESLPFSVQHSQQTHLSFHMDISSNMTLINIKTRYWSAQT